MVARDDIVGGLREALQRGETIEKAMATFYRAGYRRQDIEDSARALYSSGVSTKPVQVAKPIPKKIVAQPVKKTKPIIPKAVAPAIKNPVQTNKIANSKSTIEQIGTYSKNLQKVSSYGDNDKVQKGIQAAINELKSIQKGEENKKHLMFKKKDAGASLIKSKKEGAKKQEISNYDSAPKKKKWPIVLLIALLVILFGALIAVIVFKPEIIDFFNSLF